MAITDEHLKRLHNIDCIQPIETVEPLVGGLSHHCFKVTSLQQMYFVKLFSTNQSLSGYCNTSHCQVNPAHHLTIQHAAYLKGFSAKIIEADELGSYMVCEYIDGVTLLNSTANDTTKLKSLANILAKCHQLDAAVAPLDLLSVVESLIVKCPLTQADKQKIITRFNTQLKQVTVNVGDLVLCHGDVNFSNIILKGEDSFLIDWEYCCLAEAEYDIAMAISINKLSTNQQLIFLEYCHNSYSVNVKPSFSTDKVHMYLALCNIINALWFEQQPANVEGCSLLNEHDHFNGFIQNFLR
ncbi:phosphotransferase [Colwelliaceae bacterium BS250]